MNALSHTQTSDEVCLDCGVDADAGLSGEQVVPGDVVLTGVWSAAHSRTLMFCTLAFAQIAQAWVSRSRNAEGLPPTLFMALAVLALQLLAMGLPGLSDAFLRLVPLSWDDLALTLGAGVVAGLGMSIAARARSTQGPPTNEPRNPA